MKGFEDLILITLLLFKDIFLGVGCASSLVGFIFWSSNGIVMRLHGKSKVNSKVEFLRLLIESKSMPCKTGFNRVLRREPISVLY